MFGSKIADFVLRYQSQGEADVIAKNRAVERQITGSNTAISNSYTRTTAVAGGAVDKMSILLAKEAYALEGVNKAKLNATRADGTLYAEDRRLISAQIRLSEATLAVTTEQERQAAMANAVSAATVREERSLSRLTRGAIAGSGAFSGLGRSIAFSSGAFLGALGLVYAVRSSIKAAEDHQAALAQLGAALKAAGIDQSKYGTSIEDTLRKQRLLTGFTEEQTTRAFTLLARTTGSVEGGFRALGVAQNVALGANIDLEQASLRVARSYNGQNRGIVSLGVAIAKGIKGWQALDIVQSHFAGSAVAAAATAAVAQRRFGQALHETEVTIGTALLPALTKYLDKAATWLGTSEHQRRVQRDVNQVVHEGATAVKLLGHGIDLVSDAIGPVVKALGGFQRAAELALLIGLYGKITKVIGGFGLMGLASGVAKTKIVADAGEEVIALDAVAAAEGAVAAGAGAAVGGAAAAEGAGAAAAGGAVGLIGPVAAAVIAIGIVSTPTFQNANVPDARRAIHEFAVANGLSKTWEAGARFVSKNGKLYIQSGRAALLYTGTLPNGDVFENGVLVHAPKTAGTTAPSAAPQTGARGRSPVPPPPPTKAQAIEHALVTTEGQTGAARVKALRDAIAQDNADIRLQERLYRTDAKNRQQHLDALKRLESERAGYQSEIDAIASSNAAKEKAARDKVAAAERKREQDHRAGIAAQEARLKARVDEAKTPAGMKRAEDALIAFYRKEAHDPLLGQGADLAKRQAEFTLKAAAEAKRERAKIKKVKDDARENAIKDAVTEAALALDAAKKGTAAYNKALSAEEHALQAEIDFYKHRADLAKKGSDARRKALQEELAAANKLKALEKKTKTASTAGVGQAEFDFLQTLHGYDSTYGSDIRSPQPPAPGPTVVNVHQHFNQPTPDRNREAIYARHAVMAAGKFS